MGNAHRNDSPMAVPMLLRVLTQKSDRLSAYLSDEGLSGRPLKKMSEHAVKHVKSWINEQIYDPIKQFTAATGGLIFMVSMAVVFYKCGLPILRRRREDRRKQPTVSAVYTPTPTIVDQPVVLQTPMTSKAIASLYPSAQAPETNGSASLLNSDEHHQESKATLA